MRSSVWSAAAALAVLFSPGPARADDAPDATAAAALFTEARQLMAAGNYVAACPKLAESQALYPAADTAFDLGVCYQKASEAAFREAHAMAGASDAAGTSHPGPALAVSSQPEAPEAGRTQRVVGLAIGGAGVVGLLSGVVTTLMAKSQYDDLRSQCPASGLCQGSAASQFSSASNLALASNISFIAGAVAVGTGAVVFFTAPRSKTGPGTTVGLAPATQGAGLSFAGRF